MGARAGRQERGKGGVDGRGGGVGLGTGGGVRKGDKRLFVS